MKKMDDLYRSYCGNAEYRSQEGWSTLPKHLLERIFDRLPVRNRYRASMACRSWYTAAMSPASWRTFAFNDTTFTRKKFTMHAGWQPTIDHYRLKFLVKNFARAWRRMTFSPNTILFNLYEFLRVLTNFTEYYESHHDNPLAALKRVDFNWNLKITEDIAKTEEASTTNAASANLMERRRSSADETKHAIPPICGTGGKLLQEFTHFLRHLDGLESLSLRNLLLDSREAENFLQFLLELFQFNLSELCIRNLTKTEFASFHLGLFLNLTKLTVSPQHLNDDSLQLIGQCQRLKSVILIQDEYTKGAFPLSQAAWIRFSRAAPSARVHLKCAGRCENPLIWQPAAPVASMVYSNPNAQLTDYDVMFIVENYGETLQTYVQKGLARKFRSRKFDERADPGLILLLRECPNLTFVAVREHLSTATLLYAASLVASRKDRFRLCVRRNAILKKCDWPGGVGQNFYRWLAENSGDYSKTEERMKELLGDASVPLSDKDYQSLFL